MKRTSVVAAAAALAAGLAASFAALAGGPVPASPDPQQAVADGCGRNYTAETTRSIPTWVHVGDHDAPAPGPTPPPQRLEGLVSSSHFPELASHPTEEDVPTIHRAYDFTFDVLPDPAFAGLLGGDPAAHTGNFAGSGPSTGRVHVEREQTALPRFSWPEPGDRAALVGSWVWDCGHWIPSGERTEIHSYRALWLERKPGRPSPLSPYGESEADLVLSNDKTFAGVEADCAHRAKGVVLLFQSCLATEGRWADIRGTYRFRLTAPPRPGPQSRLRVRVLDAGTSAGAPSVRATARGRRVDVSVTVRTSPARKLVVAKRVLAGWTHVRVPAHLRVRFVRLRVRRAMDPGCANGRPSCGSKETTHGEQISRSPGEWNVYLDAAGAWTVWGSGLLRVRDGQVVRGGPALDVYVPRGRSWRLFVFTRECDFGSLGGADGPRHPMAPCPLSREFGSIADGDDRPGVIVKRFRSPAVSVGTHRGRPLRAFSTCPPVNKIGCYELDWVVTRVRDDAARESVIG